MSVNRSSENKLTQAFLWFLFFSHCFIQIRFAFILGSKYYLSKWMVFDFRCQKTFCKHNFCYDEKHTQWHWDTKLKVFHESISWFINAPKTVFHEMLWKKSFTVYPSFMKFHFSTFVRSAINHNNLEHYLIKFKFYCKNWSPQDFNNILESAFSNLSKSVKLARL